MTDRTATSAKIYIVDNEVAWDRLRDLAALDFAPGSAEEAIYLNALVAEAATVHLASPEERDSRFQAMIDHVGAVGDLGGLHGPFLTLMNDAAQRDSMTTLSAGRSAWDALAGKRLPRAVGGKILVYDRDSQSMMLVDPPALADALPPLPSGITDVAGIVNFLNGIDSRIHDAFGNPQGDPGFDDEITNIVSSLNQTAVGIAAMAGVSMLVPGGQAIGAVLLVVGGVVAVGAAAASLIGSIVDFFTTHESATVTFPPTNVAAGTPTATPDSPVPMYDPGIPDSREPDTPTEPGPPEIPENPYPPENPDTPTDPDIPGDREPDGRPEPEPEPDTEPDLVPDPESDPPVDPQMPEEPAPEPNTEPDLGPGDDLQPPAEPDPPVNPEPGSGNPNDDDDDDDDGPLRPQTPDGT